VLIISAVKDRSEQKLLRTGATRLSSRVRPLACGQVFLMVLFSAGRDFRGYHAGQCQAACAVCIRRALTRRGGRHRAVRQAPNNSHFVQQAGAARPIQRGHPMKREEALELAANGFEELSQALAEGKSEALTAYLNVMSRFHSYSFRNCLLIAMQCPTASRVAGYRQWPKLGRHVKKGEKGIGILAPLVYKQKADDAPVAASQIICPDLSRFGCPEIWRVQRLW